MLEKLVQLFHLSIDKKLNIKYFICLSKKSNYLGELALIQFRNKTWLFVNEFLEISTILDRRTSTKGKDDVKINNLQKLTGLRVVHKLRQ